MNTLLLIPSEIKLPTENVVLSILKGTTDIYIENPWFSVETAQAISKNIFTEINSKQQGKRKGIRLQSPRLFIKDNKNGKFTTYFVIQYTNDKKLKRYVRIVRPYIDEDNKNKFKNVLSIRTNRTIETDDIDKIMETLDHIVCIVIEFMLVSFMVKFDVSKCGNHAHDAQLYDALFAHIGLENMMKSSFFTHITVPYIWEDTDAGTGIKAISSINSKVREEKEDDNKKFYSLIEAIKSVLKTKIQKIVNNEDIIYKAISKTANVIPSMRKILYRHIDKNSEEKELVEDIIPDFKFAFYIKCDGMPKNFPEFMLCKTPVKNNMEHIMDREELDSLYSNVNSYFTDYECYMFIKSQIDLGFFAAGQPKSLWYVSTFIYKKKEVNKTSRLGYIEDYMLETVDENENTERSDKNTEKTTDNNTKEVQELPENEKVNLDILANIDNI